MPFPVRAADYHYFFHISSCSLLTYFFVLIKLILLNVGLIYNERTIIMFDSIVKKRRSIRVYDPTKPVTKEQLNKMLEAAMLAPSACNTRPWEFIAITKREVLDEIARIHPYAQMCKTATAAVVIVATPQKGMPEGYWPQDCGAAAEAILLTAVSLELGACWCGVYPKEDRLMDFYELFKIDKPKVPFCVIAIGTPAESPAQRGFFEESKVTYID
jgi:nitroreductase